MATGIGDALLAVKQDLLAFCESVANDLRDRKGPAGKYFLVNPELNTSEDRGNENRANFLATQFDGFFERVTQVLGATQQSDLDTIGRHFFTKDNAGEIKMTPKETVNANNFCDLFERLNAAGLHNVNGKTINFWSGPEAQKMAGETSSSLSDSNVPAISVMIKLGTLLLGQANKIESQANALMEEANQKQLAAQNYLENGDALNFAYASQQAVDLKKEAEATQQTADSARKLSSVLFTGSSAVFAKNARGKVEIFMSNYNKNEPAAMIAKNFNWDAEVGLLQELKMLNKVENIVVCFRDHHTQQWRPPIDLNNERTQHLIHVLRRNEFQATDNPKERAQLQDQNKEAYRFPTNREVWQEHGESRTPTTLKKLREYANKWKQNVAKKTAPTINQDKPEQKEEKSETPTETTSFRPRM